MPEHRKKYILINTVAGVHLALGLWRLQVRVAVSVLLGVLFVVGCYFTEATEPVYQVPAGQLAVVNVLNIAVMFVALGFIAGYSAVLADRAEAALAVEHERSERLLTNVLPVPIAAWLKEQRGGHR